MIDTPQIADELADGGVFTRGQAERPARLSIKAAGEALAAKADLDVFRVDPHGTEISIRSDIALLQGRLETALERAQERLVTWFAGTMVMHATVIGLTVGLIKLL